MHSKNKSAGEIITSKIKSVHPGIPMPADSDRGTSSVGVK